MNRRRALQWRRNWKLPVSLSVVAGALLVAGGSLRVIPYVNDIDTLPARETTAGSGTDIGNDVALFDEAHIHEVEVEVDADDRQRMLDAYRDDGEKITVPATITIDGVRIENVGIRLKGNSSLGMLGGGGPGGPQVIEAGGDQSGPRAPEPGTDVVPLPDDFADCMAEHGVDVPAAPAGTASPRDRPAAPRDGATTGGVDAGTADDLSLPYLVIFDEYVPGQRYQGVDELALRSGGIRQTLAESISIAAYEAAGLPVPRTAPAGVSINGEPEQLYSITENPDQSYLDRVFPTGDGALFKVTADQSQSFDYVGDDPTAYDGFDQVTGKKRYDKQPLIELLAFVEGSTDEEFAAGLPELLDVDELARMLALNNILQNWDSIGTGPGGNYYLWYDAVSDRFVPLAWDFNLSLGGSATASPEPLAEVGPGGAAGRPGGAVVIDVGEGGASDGDASMPPFEMNDETAAAMEDCAGEGPVIVAGPRGAADDAADGGTNDGDGGDPAGEAPGDVIDVAGSMTNALVERFVDTPEFRALYDDAMEKLSAELLASGLLVDELDALSSALLGAAEQRPSLGGADDLSDAVAAVRQFLDDRGDFLSTALG